MPVDAAKADIRTERRASPQALASRLRLSMIRLSASCVVTTLRSSPSPSFRCWPVSYGWPIGVGQLAEIEELPSPAVTRLADKLEEAGLVTRELTPPTAEAFTWWRPLRASDCSLSAGSPATPGSPGTSLR